MPLRIPLSVSRKGLTEDTASVPASGCSGYPTPATMHGGDGRRTETADRLQRKLPQERYVRRCGR